MNLQQNKGKKRLTQHQVRLLELSFTHEKKLKPELKMQLARNLGLQPRQVAIWYQNKRARWKTQSLELDHKALQLRLDCTLAEKKRLEQEVGSLKVELDKVHKMLLGIDSHQPPVPSISSSCEDGSSTRSAQLNCCWETAKVYQVDELFAGLMGPAPHSEN
ncbi:hypothetical protein NE237_032225 [Protea cynaroides]|uniref:Homeobox-leucine zipper protein n=1 Tax=Protea cynaroides TaxID=273540 RepID=A0A9Q0R2W8_9MAGN|nr:hypothetical protein NE237_032225 [Protea cynaroides]